MLIKKETDYSEIAQKGGVGIWTRWDSVALFGTFSHKPPHKYLTRNSACHQLIMPTITK